MSFELDAGSLKLVTDDKNMAAKQRLHNLGFGKGLPGKEDDFKAAVKDYRRARDGKRGVTKGDTLDDPTLESLRLEHDVEKLSGQDDRSE
jgi:hypothetical protein